MNTDLNLLRLLVVLSEEKQTVAAAKRLYVSQPTISVMLKKLREQFDDPLFVRNNSQLEPTPRCLKILNQLPLLLDQLNALYIDEDAWDISKLSGEYTLIFAPPLMSTLGVPIISKLTQLAPSLTIDCSQWNFDAVRDLEIKTNCWGMTYLPMETNKNILQRDVGRDEFMIIVRLDHPIESYELSELLQYPMCINLIHGETDASRSEKLIKKLDLGKHVNVRTSDIHVMVTLVEQSDYIGIVSKNTMKRLEGRFKFIPLPTELTDDARYRDVSLFTHQRNRADPLTAWLFKECTALLDQY